MSNEIDTTVRQMPRSAPAPEGRGGWRPGSEVLS